MLSHSAAGMILNTEYHYVDHLVPLCSILDIPLVVTEQEMADQIREFYPPLNICLIENYTDLPSYIADHFDVVFYCYIRMVFDEIFFFQQKARNKKIHTIWCPHGNSDKGQHHLFFELLRDEGYALLYGEQMLDVFKEKEVLQKLKEYRLIGNFRKAFYKKNKTFYDNLVKSKIVKYLPENKKTILYAPTWKDKESSTSFYDAALLIVEKLPDEYNLIIKPHPNILLRDPAFMEKFSLLCENRQNTLLINDFPTIYPLLDYIDIYIGDHSSVGYDCLSFNKPMFFLNQNERDPYLDRGAYLHRCGTEIKKHQYADIYSIIEAFLPSDFSHFHEIRNKMAQYCFGPEKEIEEIKKSIESLLSTLPDKELNFF